MGDRLNYIMPNGSGEYTVKKYLQLQQQTGIQGGWLSDANKLKLFFCKFIWSINIICASEDIYNQMVIALLCKGERETMIHCLWTCMAASCI